ncbi:MAG: cold shock domain-containing protein [Pseudomonadota bacterium]|jgi:cold shock CspA family protein|nr:cold shock domain-containing protein [Pseudomonadota bacterium]
MIQSGKIKNYHQERGFGFIQNDQGQDIFFHIKDFPKGVLPQVGERLTYAVAQDKKANKTKAVNITRLDYPDVQQAPSMHQPERIVSTSRQKQTQRRSSQREETTSPLVWILTVIAVISAGIFAYNFVQKSLHRHDLANQSVNEETLSAANIQADSNLHGFKCDGRVHCTEMSSKAEADWFVANCPGTKMDGDGDGDACESDSRW